MRVRIASPLRSYTAQALMVEAQGTTLDEVLLDLDRRYPGLRFRIVDEQSHLRKHMRVFVNDEMARDLTAPVTALDELTIVQALSGG